MKLKSLYLISAIFALCLLVWTGNSQNPSSKATKRSWEYKVLNTWQISEKELNALGAEGWEYVVFDSGVRGGVRSGTPNYIFRREK